MQKCCLLIAMLAALSSCSAGKKSSGNFKRVIVLGIDGMDPKFLEAHWDSLPNLSRMRKGGSFQELATTVPPQSPVAWSTFITGMDPGGHGIFDFIHRNPETLNPFSSMSETADAGRTLALGPYLLPLSAGKVESLRKGKAFWQVLSENGVPVNIIRMPTNFPPIDCEGESLSGMGTPDMKGTFGTFSFYTDAPGEKTRAVPGGSITAVSLKQWRAELLVEGPTNTLRKDRAKTFVKVTVDVDPVQPVARLQIKDHTFLLQQGEWSQWVPVQFPLIPALAHASGMVRVFAKTLHPKFEIYVSPVNIDPAHADLPITTPAAYGRELSEAVGPFYTQGMAEDTAALRQNVLTRQEYLAQSKLVAQEHLKLLRHGLSKFKEGMLFFHFFGVDQNSHMLWGKHQAELLETYKLVDEAMGWVLEKAGDATVMVMSDHGFSSFDRAVHLNTWLWKEGFLVLGDGAKPGGEEPFANVDWSRTQAYALGLNGLYLNREGREKQGILSQIEAGEVRQRIAERLLLAKDPKTGARMIDEAYDPRKIYRGDHLEAAPDLIVGFMPGYRASWQTALGSLPSTTVEDNTEAWIGDHCISAHHVPGVLLSNRPSRAAAPGLADLTATILAQFGLNKEPSMVGQSIFE